MGIKPLDLELEELARGKRRAGEDDTEDDPEPRPVISNPLPKLLFLVALTLAGSITYYFAQVNRAAVEQRIESANARPRPTLGLVLDQPSPMQATPTVARRSPVADAGETSAPRRPTRTPTGEPGSTETADSARNTGLSNSGTSGLTIVATPVPQPTEADTLARLQTEGTKLVDAGFRQAQEVGGNVLGVAAGQVQKAASESASQLQKTIYKETVGKIIQMLLDQLPKDSQYELTRELLEEYAPTPTPTPTAER